MRFGALAGEMPMIAERRKAVARLLSATARSHWGCRFGRKVSFSVLAIVGPTASGKSNLGLALCKELGRAEIVNADAMQLYRGMDIGTAKLPEAERAGIHHHLIDAVEVSEDLTAVEYSNLAHLAMDQILADAKLPVLVGGSMFYIAAALDQMDFAPTDEAIRSRLEAQALKVGSLNLHAKLSELDPASAKIIPAQNTRRVIRALEVIEITGEPYKSVLPAPQYLRPTLQLGIDVDRTVLKQRIRDRVWAMWQGGLLQEVSGLLESGVKFSRTARMAIGYSQAISQLEGELTESEAIEQTISLTNRYARRQLSWFRRDTRITWLDSSGNLMEQALQQIRLSE
jgi:tRNA dimethylallyltransferase